MPRMKGGDLISDFLIQEQVPYVFGICGHGNVGLLDALFERQDKIKLISPRHEQTAGHMADAYFRIAHRPVATLTSCGPGSCNIVMATACAAADSSAFYAITANVPTSQFNRGPFQESHRNQAAEFPVVLRPYVKRTFQPTRVDMLPLALRQSYNLMLSGRPGPVNLDVPFNLFQEEDDVQIQRSDRAAGFVRPGASPEDVKRVVDMILAAERPAFFVSHGVTLAEAGPELTRVAELLDIPVITSPNGMGAVPMPHRLAVGFIGRNGTYPANQVGRQLRSADRGGGSLRRSLVLVVDSGLFLEHPADEAGACRHRPGRDRAQLSGHARHPRRCEGVPRATRAGSDQPARFRQALRAVAGNDRWVAARVAGVYEPELRLERHAAASRARGERGTARAARRRHHLARQRRAPQLVHAVLGSAAPAGDAQLLGLLGDGLRRERYSRRQARRAGPVRVSR